MMENYNEVLRKQFKHFLVDSNKKIVTVANESGLNIHTLYGFCSGGQRLSQKKEAQLYDYIKSFTL